MHGLVRLHIPGAWSTIALATSDIIVKLQTTSLTLSESKKDYATACVCMTVTEFDRAGPGSPPPQPMACVIMWSASGGCHVPQAPLARLSCATSASSAVCASGAATCHMRLRRQNMSYQAPPALPCAICPLPRALP